jgi:hypothetical protein
LAHEVNSRSPAIMNYLQVGRQRANGPDDGPMKSVLVKIEAQTTRAAEIVAALTQVPTHKEKHLYGAVLASAIFQI